MKWTANLFAALLLIFVLGSVPMAQGLTGYPSLPGEISASDDGDDGVSEDSA
jgi:hypothetical protein